MQLTPRRKALIGIMGLGVIALIGDRLTSGPAPAKAQRAPETTPAPSAADPAPLPIADPGATAHSTGTPLLHRMQALAATGDMERSSRLDAFKPPAAWLPPPPVEVEPEPEPETDRIGAFRRAHVLKAVLTGPGGDCAVIGGRTLVIGQELDGFVLVRIGDRSVTFRSAEDEVELHLPDPSDKSEKQGQ